MKKKILAVCFACLMAVSATACDSKGKTDTKDKSSISETEESSSDKPTETTESEINSEDETSDTSEAGSEPEDLPEPTQPDDEDIDPNRHHIPLPKVDVTGTNWTQTPEGWLDDLKGNQLYNYFNKDKWDEYRGEDDPDFPYGNPKIEWAFLGTDMEYYTMLTHDGTPYTYEQLAQVLEYAANPEEYDEAYAQTHPEDVELLKSLIPETGSDSIHFYTHPYNNN